MDVKKMTDQELKDYVAGAYDVCVELMRRTRHYPKWEAISWDYQDTESAIKIASAICDGNEEYIEQCFVDIWDEAVIGTAGIDEEEYYENPEIPLWKREDWHWNEEDEEWEEDGDEDEDEAE